jgi:hypothetical protein
LTVAEKAASKQQAQTVSAEDHAALQAQVSSLQSQLERALRESERARTEAQVQGVKVTRAVPPKLVQLNPGEQMVTPDGQEHRSETGPFVYPWGASADELERLGHIRILSHDASEHADTEDAVHRWEVKANEGREDA